MTEAQRTEFIATAELHLFVNDQEVPLKHFAKYDEENDCVWIIYYRVFPPGYFKSDRNHKIVGEWIYMEDGVWDTITREGSLRVQRPLTPIPP
jgi:hypothetical protein